MCRWASCLPRSREREKKTRPRDNSRPEKKGMFFVVYIYQVLRYVFRIRLLPQPNHHIIVRHPLTFSHASNKQRLGDHRLQHSLTVVLLKLALRGVTDLYPS